jgi:O-antigen/teichoic acid export membrane protein/thymidylate kinase
VKQPAVVVEVVGPHGAGKTSLVRSLADRGDDVHLAHEIWALPKAVLFLNGLPLLPTILGLFRAAGRVLWEEGKHLIRLQALYQVLQRNRSNGHRLVLLEEGPVFGLTWFHVFAHRSVTNGGLTSWWPRALTRWARTLDIVVFLDAPDPVLARRIRTRAQSHPLKDKSDAEMFDFLQRHRAAYRRVVDDLRAHDGPTVLWFRTDEQSTDEIAQHVLEASETSRMEVDSASPPRGPDVATRRPTAPETESLTKSAALTAVASLVSYASQLIVGLVVTPILVSGLGVSLFGIWEMLKQLVGYMTATDGRPMDALRLVIANQKANVDTSATRRWVGAAFAVWLTFLPIIMLGGTVVIWLAPTITHVAPELHWTIRLTCALLVVTFLGSTLAAIPEAVLRGMNLGYKRMGLQAGLSVVGGLLSVAAVSSGWGLRGLGAAQLALAGVTGLCFWILVRNYVPAFGVARPGKQEIGSLLVMSAWLTGGIVIGHALASTDLLILGAVLSPALVATYVLTGNAARMAVSLVDFTVGAAIPGLGSVIGQGQHERAAQVRREIMTLTWLFVTAVGATILVWNRSFLLLWVGPQHYAGVWADVLIVCIMVQTAFIRSDGYIIDAALQPRRRVIVAAAAAGLMIVAALALTPSFGIVGLCLGLLLGRLPQTIGYPLLVGSVLRQAHAPPARRMARQLAIMICVFAGAAWLGERVLARHWLEWFGAAVGTFLLVLGIVLLTGLSTPARRSLLQRCATMARGLRG